MTAHDVTHPVAGARAAAAAELGADLEGDRRRAARRARLRYEAAVVQAEIRRMQSASWPARYAAGEPPRDPGK